MWRWTYIDGATIRRWEWTPPREHASREPGDEEDAEEVFAIEHGLDGIPLVMLELPHDLWAANKLRDPALAHLRARNDLSWSLHRAAHALMMVKSKWELDRLCRLRPWRWWRWHHPV